MPWIGLILRVGRFANVPGGPSEPSTPGVARNFSPINNSVGVTNGTKLRWAFGEDTDEYQLMVGTSSPPTVAVVNWTTTLTTEFTLSGLTLGQKYYWQVNTRNPIGTTPGPVLGFTLESAPVPLPGAITGLLPIDSSTGIKNSDTISWVLGSNTDEYRVLLGTTPTPSSVIVNWSSTLKNSHILTGLSYFTKYYWRVEARNATGTTQSDIMSFTLEAQPVPLPGAPYGFLPTNGATGVKQGDTISWIFGTNTTEYQVQFGTSVTPTVVVVPWTPSLLTSFTLPTLLDNTNYYWRVNVRNATGTTTGPIIGFTSYKEVLPAPGPITSLSPANASTGIENGDTLSWAFGSNTEEYQLLFGTATTPSVVVVPWTSSLATSYLLSALSPETTYYWMVQARNSGGAITSSPIMGFTLAAAALPLPGIPTGLTPANATTDVENGDSLSWTFGSNTTEYQLLLGTEATPVTEEIPWTSSLQNFHILTGLTDGANYYWRVNVRNATGEVSSAITGFVMKAAPAPLPSTPFYFRPNDGTVLEVGDRIQWNIGANTTETQLWFGTANPPTNIVQAYDGTNKTQYVIPSGLTPNTTYYWYVQARNAAGVATGGVNNIKTPVAPTPPVAPTLVTPLAFANDIDSGDTLTWTFGADTIEYRVLVDTVNPPTAVAVAWTNTLATTHILAGLSPDETYYWRVDARNPVGTTSSVIRSFDSVLSPPITGLNITSVNMDYLINKQAVFSALVDPGTEEATVIVQYADTPDFVGATSTSPQTVTVLEGETFVPFILPVQPIGRKYARIKATNSDTLYSAVFDLWTYPGSGRSRVQTDYETAFNLAKAGFTGTTYYVDPDCPTPGNARTPETAALSLTTLPYFGQGVKILLKAGCTVTAVMATNNRRIYMGTYGGTERANIVYSTAITTCLGNTVQMILENLSIRNTYLDANGLPSGIGVNFRAANSWLYNCEVAGWGQCVTTNPTGGTPGNSWSGAYVLYSHLHHSSSDTVYVMDTTDFEMAHCYIHHSNLAYFYSTNENDSPGDGIQIQFQEKDGTGDFLRFNVHHNTIDRSDTGNKFCMIWGAGAFARKVEGYIENNEFIIAGNTVSALYGGRTELGFTRIRHNDFFGTGSGIAFFNDNRELTEIAFENNIIKNIANGVTNNYSKADIKNNTFIDVKAVYASGNLTDREITFTRNIVQTSNVDARLIYGNDYQRIVASDYNCYDMPTIVSSAPTLAEFQTLLGKDANSISTDPLMNAMYQLQTGSPCISVGGSYIGAIPYTP